MEGSLLRPAALHRAPRRRLRRLHLHLCHVAQVGWRLHPEPNEMLHVPGLDIFLGTPPPPLHIFYQGLLKKLFACVFRSIQRPLTNY